MSRILSWESLAGTLVDKGDLMKCSKWYDAGKVYLEKIEKLSATSGYYATGHALLLARLHQAKFDACGETVDALEAAKVYHQIFSKSNYDPAAKAEAALRYAVMITKLTFTNEIRSKEVLESLGSEEFGTMKLDDALVFVADVWQNSISQGLTRAQQLYFIRQISPLPAGIAYAAKLAGRTSLQILSIYERSRSIIWDRLLNQRTHFDSLNQRHPKLSLRYRELNQALEAVGQPDLVFKELPRDKFQIEADLGSVVEEIRQEEGFEDFLFTSLSSKQSCSDSVSYNDEVIELSQFSDDACRSQYASLRRALECRDLLSEANDILYNVLRWLWYNVSEPVLCALELLRTNAEYKEELLGNLPRLWWITCSWANALPIHAAGDYKLSREQGMSSTVMDNVISSYTPTLKALKYARMRLQHLTANGLLHSSTGYALLAAMSETPDREPLEYAVPEAEAVQAILTPELSTTLISDSRLTRKSAIEHLRTCKIAHLACHGEADPQDPLRTKLLLSDWGPRPLHVSFLMRMEMANCQLAYLSACQTAVNRDQTLFEEGLHLSGVFQMAGVPNTVATIWDIDDAEAFKVATGFNRNSKNDSGRIDVSRSARALHRVTRYMRDSGLSPFTWGGYVHLGA